MPHLTTPSYTLPAYMTSSPDSDLPTLALGTGATTIETTIRPTPSNGDYAPPPSEIGRRWNKLFVVPWIIMGLAILALGGVVGWMGWRYWKRTVDIWKQSKKDKELAKGRETRLRGQGVGETDWGAEEQSDPRYWAAVSTITGEGNHAKEMGVERENGRFAEANVEGSKGKERTKGLGVRFA
jgi:hypothetical protein